MWSISRPCPVISWKRTPPKPPPTTTGIEPDGAGRAASRVSAFWAAPSAIRPGSSANSSKPRWAPRVSAPGPPLAPRRGPGLPLVAAAGHGLHADPGAGAVVAGEEAVGVGDRDDAAGLGVGRGQLGDLVAHRAAALVELAEELRLA